MNGTAHIHLREAARGLGQASALDVSDRTILSMKGPDGLDLLQRITTNDLSKIQVGGVAQTIFTNERGRMIDLVSVVRQSQTDLLLIAHATVSERLIEWLNRFIIMEDTRVEPPEESWSHFIIFHGDQSGNAKALASLTTRLFDQPVDEKNLLLRKEHFYFLESLRHQPILHIVSRDVSPAKLAAELVDAGFTLSTSEEYARFRVQIGIPDAPNEINDSYNPLEADLSSLVSFTKGCYVGQEVITRLDTYKKVQRALVQLKLSDLPAEIPTQIFDEREAVGSVTTLAQDPREKSITGLGYVNHSSLERNAKLSITSGGTRIQVLRAKTSNDSM